jgi:hypothetical protein
MTAETGTYRWMAPEVCLSSFFLPFEIWFVFHQYRDFQCPAYLFVLHSTLCSSQYSYLISK